MTHSTHSTAAYRLTENTHEVCDSVENGHEAVETVLAAHWTSRQRLRAGDRVATGRMQSWDRSTGTCHRAPVRRQTGRHHNDAARLGQRVAAAAARPPQSPNPGGGVWPTDGRAMSAKSNLGVRLMDLRSFWESRVDSCQKLLSGYVSVLESCRRSNISMCCAVLGCRRAPLNNIQPNYSDIFTAPKITITITTTIIMKLPLCADRGRNIEHVSLPTLCQSGKKDILNLRRWQGRSFSVLQRVSVLVQRYNAVLLHDTLRAPECT